MTSLPLAPRARRELLAAIAWIADDNPDAAEAMFRATVQAIRRIVERPGLGRRRPDLAADRFRFFAVTGFSYLLVYDPDLEPLVVARIVHQSRDLPTLLADLDEA